MRVVIQRVSSATVKTGNKLTGNIDKGLLILVAFNTTDSRENIIWMCEKICKMRIFQDNDGKMNLSVQDVKGSLLVVSQFTLYGDASKGNRPSFIQSAPADLAEKLYNDMVLYLRDYSGMPVETGVFGAMMEVELCNDGPVTIILDK